VLGQQPRASCDIFFPDDTGKQFRRDCSAEASQKQQKRLYIYSCQSNNSAGLLTTQWNYFSKINHESVFQPPQPKTNLKEG